jgi:glyoxylase-like metal-dependent hydrolase (beta-lactamase superfamily II)
MAAEQIPVDPHAIIQGWSEDDRTHEITPDLAYQRLAIVNVIYFGSPGAGDRGWVLIDAGVMGSHGAIRRAAETRFGDARPAAIALTHGHFDHVGALEDLAKEWDCPVYAHPLERPYLDGSASYPPPDPTVGGGMMSALSGLYPRGPVNVRDRLHDLPVEASVPFMPGWAWIHVPGHTVGQVAFWRAADRTLIAADAFITTRQESAYAVMMQKAELHGPPKYFTQDWVASRESVKILAALEPERVITGHGRAMGGPEMRAALHALARDFDRVAVPPHGRYVEHPASLETGEAYQTPQT